MAWLNLINIAGKKALWWLNSLFKVWRLELAARYLFITSYSECSLFTHDPISFKSINLKKFFLKLIFQLEASSSFPAKILGFNWLKAHPLQICISWLKIKAHIGADYLNQGGWGYQADSCIVNFGGGRCESVFSSFPIIPKGVCLISILWL